MANVLANLRSLMPHRALTRIEAMRIAELQANRLLAYGEITKPAVPDALIAKLPLVHVERSSHMRDSGRTQWVKGRWHILINSTDPILRQRFSLAHEFKHVLDGPFGDLIYPDASGHKDEKRAEQVCDYFAACLLMPRPWIKTAWRDGFQSLPVLSRVFAVSQSAIRVRLLSIGLVEPQPRHCEVRIPA